MKPGSERAARKKLLLLEGQLQRVELLQARHALQGAARPAALAGRLPQLLRSALAQRAIGLLPTVLPWLLGAGKGGRWLRRGVLAVGAVAALASVLSSARERARAREADSPPPECVPADDIPTDEKNPGLGRDSAAPTP